MYQLNHKDKHNCRINLADLAPLKPHVKPIQHPTLHHKIQHRQIYEIDFFKEDRSQYRLLQVQGIPRDNIELVEVL